MAIGTPVSIGTGTGNASSSTLTFTLTASVAIGDFIVVSGGIFGGRVTHTASDSGGNTYATHIISNQRTAIASAQCTTALTSGVSTITMTWSGPEVARTVGACKVSGIATSSAFDQSASANGSVAAWSGGTTPSTTQADELVIGACSCDTAAAATSTPGGSYSELFDITNGGAFQLTMTYLIVSGTGAQNPTGTWTSSGWAWNGATATFKAAAGGGGGTVVEQLSALGVG